MKKLSKRLAVTAAFVLLLPIVALSVELNNGHWVDLSHEFSNETIKYPRSKPYVHTPSKVGLTMGGFFMATYNYSSSEHVGTHLDAPLHFREGGMSIEQISIQQVIGEAVVIDVKSEVAADQMYLITVDDILAWEKEYGMVPADSIVLFNTGLANVWPDPIKYFGTDKSGNEGYAGIEEPGHSPRRSNTLIHRTQDRSLWY